MSPNLDKRTFYCNDSIGQRIPSYIVDLPSIVLNTPGGQMLRPMIENMQNSVYSQQMRGPTGSSAYSIEASSLTQSLVPQSITPANIESKPLVSIDHTTVEALGNKIISLKTTEKDDTGLPLNKFAFSEEEQLIIKGIMLIVTASDRSSSDISSFCSEDSCRVLTKVMEKYPAAQMSSLFLMRLLVLQETIIFKTVHMCAVAMVDSVIAKLAAGQGAVNGFASVPSTVMALCTLANLLSHESGEALIFDRAGVAEAVLDIVLVGLSHSRVEVRQMSATVAFNFTLAFKEADNKGLNQLAANSTRRIICTVGQEAELNLLAVQLFCGVMEGIHSETDGSVRYRRLCVALKLVRIGGQALKDLGRDLGFHNDLNFLNTSSEVEMLVVGEMKRGFI